MEKGNIRRNISSGMSGFSSADLSGGSECSVGSVRYCTPLVARCPLLFTDVAHLPPASDRPRRTARSRPLLEMAVNLVHYTAISCDQGIRSTVLCGRHYYRIIVGRLTRRHHQGSDGCDLFIIMIGSHSSSPCQMQRL